MKREQHERHAMHDLRQFRKRRQFHSRYQEPQPPNLNKSPASGTMPWTWGSPYDQSPAPLPRLAPNGLPWQWQLTTPGKWCLKDGVTWVRYP